MVGGFVYLPDMLSNKISSMLASFTAEGVIEYDGAYDWMEAVVNSGKTVIGSIKIGEGVLPSLISTAFIDGGDHTEVVLSAVISVFGFSVLASSSDPNKFILQATFDN